MQVLENIFVFAAAYWPVPFTWPHSCSRANLDDLWGAWTSQLCWAWGFRGGVGWDTCWFFMLFQVPAVLLWGESVQSPGCCSGWILQTANRCKCVLFTGFLPVCLSVDLFIHSRTPEPAYTVLPGWVLSHHRRACVFKFSSADLPVNQENSQRMVLLKAKWFEVCLSISDF